MLFGIDWCRYGVRFVGRVVRWVSMARMRVILMIWERVGFVGNECGAGGYGVVVVSPGVFVWEIGCSGIVFLRSSFGRFCRSFWLAGR